jgi:hypothetical protein
MQKTIKILLVAMILLTGCKTTRKATESSLVKSSEQTEAVRKIKEVNDFKEAKDVSSELETVTEETVTEFYEPRAGSKETGEGRPESVGPRDERVEHGAVKSLRTIRTVTTKKDLDKGKVEATGERNEVETVANNKETKEVKDFKEVKKNAVARWQIIALMTAFLVTMYFLVKNGSVRIPFLTKAVNWIDAFFRLFSA